jgi:hypothetical protein
MRPSHCLAAVALSLAACGHVPTPEELATQTTADLESFWKEAVATARITNTMKVRDDFFTSIEGMQRYPESSRPTIPDSSSTESTISDLKVFANRIFTQANVIQQGGSTMEFKVTGAALCTPTSGTGSADSTCVSNVDKLNISVRVVGGSSGLDVTLLLNQTTEVGTVEWITGQSFSVTVDLANAQGASEFVNASLGQDSPFRNLTFVGSGKVQVVLAKRGGTDFETSVNALSDLSGSVTDNDGFTRSGSTPARSPLFYARVSGPTNTLTANVDVGSSAYRGKASDMIFDYNDNTPVSWALSGLTFSASAADDGPRGVSNITAGSGVSTLAYGNQTVASFELNPDMGHKLDVDVTTGAGGLALFTAKPGLSAALVFDFQALPNASQYNSDVQNATYSYALTSSGQPPQVELTRATQTSDGTLKLSTGSLSLSSPSDGNPRNFTAVSCLQWGASQTSNGLLDVFSTVNCP